MTLGGGINYLGNKYGFTMDTVEAFEVVLSSGRVVSASALSNPDLFCALKGGSNNFGIVTKFTFKVFSVPQVSGAVIVYGEDQVPAYTQAISDLTKYQTPDQVGGAFFTVQYKPSVEAITIACIGLQVGNISPPPVFANFSAIPNLFSNYAISTPLVWHNGFDTPYQAAR